jgi:tetratricopeptide (TPR) repeat protein
MASKKEKNLLIFILLVLGALKFIFFTNLIIPPFDSYEYLLTAKSLWSSHTLLVDTGAGYKFGWHEPGYPFLIALSYPLLRDFEASAAFVTVLAGVLSVFLIYLLAEKAQKGAGKFAAFLLATSSLHLQFSNAVLRDIPSLCLVCLILYLLYNKQVTAVKAVFLGLLVSFAYYIHFGNVFFLIFIPVLILREKRFRALFLFLGTFFITIAPYWFQRLFKWPRNICAPIIGDFYKNVTFNFIARYTGHFLKSLFLRLIEFDPLILIFAIAGVFLILRKNTAKELTGRFWKIYSLSYLFICYLICIYASGTEYHVGDSYLLPLLVPLVLIGSISLAELAGNKQIPKKQFRIRWIGSWLLAVYMIVIYRPTIENIINKTALINESFLKWAYIFSAGLILIWFASNLLLKEKRLKLNPVIIGIFIAFGIQVFDEGVQIKGRYKMLNRGKELSSDINALKGRILPRDAYLMGLYDAMAVLYHTDYPLLHENYARLIIKVDASPKQNIDRVMELAAQKPVIFVYNYLYRYYLDGMGKKLYSAIQEKYQDKLIFSNLKLNVKMYLFGDIYSSIYYDELYGKAVSYFKDELKKTPGSLKFINYLGWAYYCSGEPDRAIETWRKKLELSPGDSDTYNNIGLAYAKGDKYREAIKEYKNALGFKPLDDPHRVRWARAMIYFNLAHAFEKINDKKNAVESWKNFYNSIPYPENREIMERHIEALGYLQ